MEIWPLATFTLTFSAISIVTTVSDNPVILPYNPPAEITECRAFPLVKPHEHAGPSGLEQDYEQRKHPGPYYREGYRNPEEKPQAVVEVDEQRHGEGKAHPRDAHRHAGEPLG